MLGIKQIKTDGTEVDLGRKHLTLQEAQALVATGTQHALIELVPIYGQNPYKVGDQIMFVHEEGLLHQLPRNPFAQDLADVGGNVIVGDVIIVENEKSDFGDDDDEEAA